MFISLNDKGKGCLSKFSKPKEKINLDEAKDLLDNVERVTITEHVLFVHNSCYC